jgi:trehalose 6-phosphate synthase
MIGAMAGEGRHMRIGTFPVGIETESFNRRARRMERSEFAANVRKSVPGELMIGVDRLDYSKGLPLRLDAFERFLMTHPEWHNKVTYLQITPKSRSTIQEYADIERTVEAQAGRINSTYGDVSWMPVRYVNRTYGRTALGGLYRSARVGLVTPLRDGMNLVAKEYLAAQDENDPGVLILSRFAGAAAELKAAVLVNPYDHEAVAVAIARAFAMSLNERQQRHAELWRALLVNDISTWGDKFLAALTGEPMRRTGLSSPMLPEPGFSLKNLAAE